MGKLKRHGRFIVAFLALTIAFVLSVKFSDRGVQFDLKNSSVSASEGKDGDYQLSALKIFNRVLLRIKDNYYDPSRVDPNKMLVAALDEVQNQITELVVTFVGGKQHPTAIKIQVNGASKSFKVKPIESLWEMSFRLQKMFRFVEEHLPQNPDLDAHQIEYAAINGILSTLDPHSTLLPPRHYEEMQTQTGGKFGGLGIVISIRDGQLTVMSPIPGTPAAKQGIKAKDKIVRIGDESTINMDLQEAVNLMRGDPGTKVDLWVSRSPWSEPHKFRVTRAVINIESVDSHPLADKIGYISIKNFQANTYPDLVKHLKKLKKQMGGLQGLVLDLRDNPGGLLDQAIKVSDTFLDHGTIVSTVGVGNRMRDKKVATKSGTEPHYPILVLVNAGSASASEIVSGALQNNKRALIVGDTTFGKGSVQVLYEFDDNSALKLTIAQYLTPGGISIQNKGISPDLRLVPVSVDDGEVDMFPSDNVLRERDLKSHLSNSAVRKNSDERSYVRYLTEAPANPEDQDFQNPNEFHEDFEIKFAQQLLASAGSKWKAPALYKQLQPELDKIAKREMKQIQKKLDKLKVDWTDGDNPAHAKVDLQVSTSASKDTVKAGDKITFTAKLTNKGTKTLHRIKAISKSDNSVLDDREFLFGEVKPGQTKTWSVDVEMPKETPNRFDQVAFQVSGPRHTFGQKVDRPVRIVGLDRPQFAFAYELQDANGDGVLQKGEEVTFHTLVKNVGAADSNKTLVYLKSLAGKSIYLESGRATIDSIKKGGEKSADFKFKVNAIPDKDHVEVEVDVFDTVFRDFVHKKIKLPFAAAADKVTKASGLAKVKNGPAKLYLGATSKSDVAAMATKGATLPVVAKLNDWIKVDLGARKAWIQKGLVDYDAHASGKLSGVSRRTLYQSPQVELDPATMMTSKDQVPLKGLVEDDSSIKDYYIFVFNREDGTNIHTRKMDYTKVDGNKAKIASNIPLFKGMNRISIIARDEDGMETTQDAYVYRN